MNRLKAFLLILGLVAFCGCASQGRKMLLTFEKEDVTPAELETSIKRIEPVVVEDPAHEQFRIVKALRYITKYNANPHKRLLAVRGLLFLTVFSDDRDIRASAESRLRTILNDDSEDFAIRAAILDGKKEIVIGERVYHKMGTSVFNDRSEYEVIYPDVDDRGDALDFLIDQFPVLPSQLQAEIIDAFGEIFQLTPICLEEDDTGCEETDGEEQAEWKRTLGAEIRYWIGTSACDWPEVVVVPEVIESLKKIIIQYADFFNPEGETDCMVTDPLTEDIYTLEQRSIVVPLKQVTVGLYLPLGKYKQLSFANLELGFGNGRDFGIVFGGNFDEQWINPARETYLNIQFRPNMGNTAVGATRISRQANPVLKDQQSGEVAGSVDGISQFVPTISETDFYITSLFPMTDDRIYLHLYLGTIKQSLSFQYFIRRPDLSVLAELFQRRELEVVDRVTDTAANENKKERQDQAKKLQTDLMIGVKFTDFGFFKWLFVGSPNRVARKGVLDSKLQYSIQQETLQLSFTRPF